MHERIINLRHAFRNTLVPLVTIAGLQIGFLMAYAVVVEVVFQWPGMGLLFIQALQITDIPVISAFLLMTGFVFVMINLVVDMAYFAIDPRLRSDRAVSLSEEGIVG